MSSSTVNPTQWMASPERVVAAPVAAEVTRVQARGKFLFAGGVKYFVRGVTYGPFAPGAMGEYHTPAAVRRDFEQIAAAGFNAVRTYTVPPTWLLDEAGQRGLRVMVGLPWEQHVAFLGRRRLAADVVRRVREGARSCAGH